MYCNSNKVKLTCIRFRDNSHKIIYGSHGIMAIFDMNYLEFKTTDSRLWNVSNDSKTFICNDILQF